MQMTKTSLDVALEMTDEERRRLLKRSEELAGDFLASIGDRDVIARASREELRGVLATPIPEHGEDPIEVIESLAAQAPGGHMASTGPRFFGFVIGGALPVAIGVDWLTAAWDQNAGLFVLSPLTSVVEEVTGEWVIDLLGLPKESSVGFVTGCQMANFTGLAAARHGVLRKAGWNVEEQGLMGAPRLRVIVGGEAHVTINVALRLLGLGSNTVEIAEADDQGRMRPEVLRRLFEEGDDLPTIVCAQLGNVDTGAFDPIEEISSIAHDYGAWVHVDGAFGLWANASTTYRHLTRGAHRADSWATDAHKWLNVPQDSGIVIVKDSAAHRAAMTANAAYLQKSDGAERDEVDWVPDFSRRARVFPAYAVLRTLGRRGLEQLVDNCCDRTKQMVRILTQSPNVESLCDVVLNQALVRFVAEGRDPDELTRNVIRRIQEDGTSWFGGTTWQGKGAMRISSSNWMTTREDVERSAAAVLASLDAELA